MVQFMNNICNFQSPEILKKIADFGDCHLGLGSETLTTTQRLYRRRNLFEILLNQPEIKLYSPFSDWFGTKQTSIWCKINRKMVNTIWFRVDLIRFRKYISVCIGNNNSLLNELNVAELYSWLYIHSLIRTIALEDLPSDYLFLSPSNVHYAYA